MMWLYSRYYHRYSTVLPPYFSDLYAPRARFWQSWHSRNLVLPYIDIQIVCCAGAVTFLCELYLEK